MRSRLHSARRAGASLGGQRSAAIGKPLNSLPSWEINMGMRTGKLAHGGGMATYRTGVAARTSTPGNAEAISSG